MTRQYQRIAAHLRGQIERGHLSPGDQLPTNERLMADFGVARGTVLKALDELLQQGLIESRRPVGMFVRDRRRIVFQTQASGFPPIFPGLDDGLLELLSDGKACSITQTIDVKVVLPPAEVAERLGLGDQSALLRHRVRSVGKRPVNIADAYYPYHLVKGNSEIQAPTVIKRGVARVLTELGLREVRRRVHMVTRMPTPAESTELQLGPGTPVSVQIYTTRTEGDVPVQCSVSVLPGDLYMLVAEQELSTDPAELVAI